MKHIALTAIAYVLASGLSFGQDAPDIPDEVIKNLQYFVGTWKLEGEIAGVEVKGMSTFRWSRGKHCLTENSTITSEEGRVVRTGVIGWDASRDQMVHGTFMSNGDAFILRYTAKPNEVFEGEVVLVRDGEEIRGENRFVRTSADVVEYESELTDGSTAELTITRMAEREGRKKRAKKKP